MDIETATNNEIEQQLLDRDGAACTIAGCTSRYRLQVHHIKSWIDGGRTDPENTTTVCWFHHHIVIHGPPWLEQARAKGMVITETPKAFVSTT